MGRWTQYCIELYNHKVEVETSILDVPSNNSDEDDNNTILREEVEEAVKALKRGKSPGIDNIPGAGPSRGRRHDYSPHKYLHSSLEVRKMTQILDSITHNSTTKKGELAATLNHISATGCRHSYLRFLFFRKNYSLQAHI